jgi:hypothetical protein
LQVQRRSRLNYIPLLHRLLPIVFLLLLVCSTERILSSYTNANHPKKLNLTNYTESPYNLLVDGDIHPNLVSRERSVDMKLFMVACSFP